jgi:hypothetical protein
MVVTRIAGRAAATVVSGLLNVERIDQFLHHFFHKPSVTGDDVHKPGVHGVYEKLVAIRTDTCNRLRFGNKAPLFAERIYVDPQHCEGITLSKKKLKKLLGFHPVVPLSGAVIDSWPIHESDVVPLTDLPKIKFCIDHWVNNVAWEHTGVYEFYEARGQNIDKIVQRYRNLDKIFNTVRSEGRLRSAQELNPCNFRETNGIRINIGPSGQLIFYDVGTHRLAIAMILGIRLIPAQLGAVFAGSLHQLQKLREIPVTK